MSLILRWLGTLELETVVSRCSFLMGVAEMGITLDDSMYTAHVTLSLPYVIDRERAMNESVSAHHLDRQ